MNILSEQEIKRFFTDKNIGYIGSGFDWTDFSLNYLYQKHKDICQIYPHKDYLPVQKLECDLRGLNDKDLTEENFDDYCMEYNMMDAEELLNIVKNCEKRFFIIFIGTQIIYKDRICSHSSVVIYDKKNKIVERYDPMLEGIECNPNHIVDKIWETFFSHVDKNIKYEGNSYFCFRPQKIQYAEKLYERGLCALWSLWFVDMKLGNPDKTSNEMLEIIKKFINKQKTSYTVFILSYAKYIIETDPKFKEKIFLRTKK